MAVNYQDFERRLARYGLTLADARGRHIVGGGGDRTTFALSGGTQSPTHVLRTSDLDQLKSWLGYSDDDVASGRIRLCEASLALTSQDFATPMRNVQSRIATAADLKALSQAARAYVFGDSRKVASLKNVIEAGLGPFMVAVLAADTLTIQPGNPYVVKGPNPVVLAVGEVLFTGPTAQLISYAPFKLDATSLVMQ